MIAGDITDQLNTSEVKCDRKRCYQHSTKIKIERPIQAAQRVVTDQRQTLKLSNSKWLLESVKNGQGGQKTKPESQLH